MATLGRGTFYVELKRPAKVWSPAPPCLSSKSTLQSHLTGCKTFSRRQVSSQQGPLPTVPRALAISYPSRRVKEL